jgi:hypothetical protein
MKQIEVGDKAAYSAKWLRSTGQIAGDIGHARGVVMEIKAHTKTFVLATVDWGTDEFPNKILLVNLAKIGPNGEFWQHTKGKGIIYLTPVRESCIIVTWKTTKCT